MNLKNKIVVVTDENDRLEKVKEAKVKNTVVLAASLKTKKVQTKKVKSSVKSKKVQAKGMHVSNVVYNVPGDFDTIQAAIDAAATPGQYTEIRIAPGIYEENLNIDHIRSNVNFELRNYNVGDVKAEEAVRGLQIIGDNRPFLPSYVNGYEFSHEDRCNGKIIALLPYKEVVDTIEILLRNEVTPCWGMNHVISSITGGLETDDPRDTAIHELKEEAGYDADNKQLISLGTSFGTKSTDSVYYLYSINLTNAEQGEATTDGSELEKKANCVWCPLNKVLDAKDPQVSVMFLRLCSHLRRPIF